MKSNPSFFNRTVFRKNITRFAPVWGLYTICLIMGMLMMAADGTAYWFIENTANCIQAISAVTMCYAAIVAVLLFGDLYNTRMCYALHAMPLRRECWFLTNLVSGLFFSIVPTLIMTLPSILLASFAKYTPGSWQIPLWWFLGANLSYLYFFSLAVLCTLCVGSRFAALLVYAIVNSLPWVVYALVDTLYTPLLYGVHTWEKPFQILSPVFTLCDTNYVSVNRVFLDEGRTLWDGTIVMGDWHYLITCALVGVGLLGLALILYRRRKLESAGEFISLKALKPIFLVIYTLCAGVLFYGATGIFVGTNGLLPYVFLIIGLFVGWFTGHMLLQRTVRVFKRRAFAGCGILVAVLLLSLGINALDPFGIVSWTPEPEEVKGVTITSGHYQTEYVAQENVRRGYGSGDAVRLYQEGDIRRAIRLQALDLAAHENRNPLNYHAPYSYTINYHMADGSTVSRYYEWDGKPGEMYNILNPWFSSTECVFGLSEAELLAAVPGIDQLVVNGEDLTEQLTQADLQALAEALAADCAAGHMAQRSWFHYYHEGQGDRYFDLHIDIRGSYLPVTPSRDGEIPTTSSGYVIAEDITHGRGFYLEVWACCENTMAWLEAQDLMDFQYEGKY